MWVEGGALGRGWDSKRPTLGGRRPPAPTNPNLPALYQHNDRKEHKCAWARLNWHVNCGGWICVEAEVGDEIPCGLGLQKRASGLDLRSRGSDLRAEFKPWMVAEH